MTIKCDYCRGSLGLNAHHALAYAICLLSALRLISVALMKEQWERYAVLISASRKGSCLMSF